MPSDTYYSKSELDTRVANYESALRAQLARVEEFQVRQGLVQDWKEFDADKFTRDLVIQLRAAHSKELGPAYRALQTRSRVKSPTTEPGQLEIPAGAYQ